ncbi:uncharacterized protein CANTADRAFT_26641 [Suhomyces tanzawaensis NRRL Y-17324]|uniref:Transcription factor IWS1 n=1 Tax=Suhomyces tanzawaensis NRRL Y-17324 TaxID=984487 RepID=A0A1E4SGL4_9ASCO|nr:uncharacterized protein CANTADRAFT_26641 [Suhomyces tanzawaensis NRRL Y-17324]ODV78605.1 hypothetical protein CANTADRAFT_26641 [Suhomyces tanzawaensis NRRL Y-17324]
MSDNEAKGDFGDAFEFDHEQDQEGFDQQAEAETTSGEPQQESGQSNEAQQSDNEEYDENLYSIKAHKLEGEGNAKEVTQKKNVRKTKRDNDTGDRDIFGHDTTLSVPQDDYLDDVPDFSNEDPQARKRRLLEEKMENAVKTKGVRRRKADEDDLERMQDDKIDSLKDQMIRAANLDVEKNSQGQIATEKLKLLKPVLDILSRADLAISILDNNLLEAVRLWLEPLPDASMPAYQIQKELIYRLDTLPIKTDHLVASGLGKVLVFYQRSKRTEPSLKKIVDRLIGDWTRPILNKSDSYKDRTIQFNEYNKHKYTNQLASARSAKPKEVKTLYEENAARRKRAAIPSARTAAYKIAPRVDPNMLRRQQARGGGAGDERFRRINQKLTLMSIKKKTSKKGGPSIEGRNLGI